jgi:hypothetical protein
VKTVIFFLRAEVSPTSSVQFEEGLDQVLRELGRIITEWTYNHVEPDEPLRLPHDVHWKRAGYRRPVLCVGRDGISLGMQPDGSFEVATTATMTVYDRQGKRLGTVYLAQPPELGQPTMTRELTALLEEVLTRWQGPTPQWCYVTDAGDNETAYYRQVLRRMRHPRTGQRLEWQWVVDYYHASQRITVLAEALFGQTRAAEAWARRMRKLLLKPNGPSRVLHAAAARRSRHGVIAHRRRDYNRAYEYLRQRTRFMQYWEHRRRHLPIGSGITETAPSDAVELAED